MQIEQIFPPTVEAKAPLRSRLAAEALAAHWNSQKFEEVLSAIPVSLLTARCFKDKMGGLWRYEFGRPYEVGENLVHGTHMWLPVTELFQVLSCAFDRLSGKERGTYLQRLAYRDKHQEVLAEMVPMLRVSKSIPARFEVSGMGRGNTTVDWMIGPFGGRLVLLDVKRRAIDLIHNMGRLGPKEIAPQPDHDVAALFKSVEGKFQNADPNRQMQGAWVMTYIKQERSELKKAFDALDKGSVHFAVLGDFQPDVHILVRRDEDKKFLLDLLQVREGPRFTFDRA